MTKFQLLRALEPFTDDIEIVMKDNHDYIYVPHVYYSIGIDGDARIIMGRIKLEDKKWVELKVEQ